MSPVFLDTGYIIALEAIDDQHHSEALHHWQSFCASGLSSIVTTSYVFDEIVTFFNSRNRHQKAVEIGERLLNSSSVQFRHVDQELFCSAWKLFKQRSDKRFSLTDCVSFIVMEERDLQMALTFDRHFVQAGFQKMP
ncbi:MAG: type II toxin-antitoxin system VapC family toxin [Synechococcus sp.]